MECDGRKHRMRVASPIFDISRLRMGIDGCGITTLVTFMGCPLKCSYCINDQCHDDIYDLRGRVTNKNVRVLSPRQLYNIVKQDDIYFQVTGGGVCFGGGEPTLHHKFIVDFAKLCPKNWKITIETSLCCPSDVINTLAPCVGEWIVDVKEANPAIYERYTGAQSNIMQSLQALLATVPQSRVTLKVPHIPGFNTSDDVEASVRKLRDMGFCNIVEFNYVVTK